MSLSQRRSQLLGRLRHRRTRVREGLVLVEGVRAAGEALAAGAELRFACVSPRLDETPVGGALRAALEDTGADVVSVDDAELTSLSDTEHPQGVLLVCAEPGGAAPTPRRSGRYVVLDAIQDPGNVGTLVRAAVAFALDAVLVLDGTADAWGPKAVRASAGMAFRLPVCALDVGGVLDFVREGGLSLLLAAADGADVRGEAGRGGWVLTVGNEGAGVREELRAATRRTVGIPMPGPAESLNAGVAGAILLYALTDAFQRENPEEEGA